MSSTASPATNPAVRAELEAMSAATIDRYLAPAGARAVRGRSTTKAGPGLRSSIKIRRAGGRGGGRARASSRPVTVAHCGPVLKGEFARTVEHDPMCSRGGPSPARSAGVADKAHHLGPRRRRGRDPATACRARDFAGGSEFTGHGVVRRAGNPGHPHLRPLAPVQEERPGHHRDPRSNHVVRRYASLLPPRTPTPSAGCRAACGSWSTSESTS